MNRNTDEDIVFEADIRSFAGYRVAEFTALEQEDMKAVNSALGETVTPAARKDYELSDGLFTAVLKKCSWNVIRFTKF